MSRKRVEDSENNPIIRAPVKLLETMTGWSYEAAKSLFYTLLVVILLRASVIEVYRIPSSSMSPTLYRGDHIIVSKISYALEVPFSAWFLKESKKIINIGSPKRGDVIAFHLERDVNKFFIKRVIGIPGDEITMKKGLIYINNKPIQRIKLEPEKDYKLYKEMAFLIKDHSIEDVEIFKETLPDSDSEYMVFNDQRLARFGEMMKKKVPADHLFVLGDNRNELGDSRFFGMIPINRVSGKSKIVWLNYIADEQGFQFLLRRIGVFIK